MAVTEKRAPKIVSICAIVLSVGATAMLWIAGAENPRKFVGTMAINHHASYGSTLPCYSCHVPVESKYGFQTRMDCLTSGCHGPYKVTTSKSEALEELKKENARFPDGELRAEHYLSLHLAFQDESCTACHVEHKVGDATVPKGWDTWEKISRNTAFIPEERISIFTN